MVRLLTTEDEIRGPLADHENGHHRVDRGQSWEDGTVHNPKPSEPMNPKRRVNHGGDDNGLYITAVVPSLCRKDEFMADLDGAYTSAVRTWPELEAVMGAARRVGPIRVMSRWHGYFRRSAGPGWVLVGDAGHFKDPTPGQGIADALRQVARLAPTIQQALGGANADQ